MRVKTFQGRTLEELLPQVRDELGPNAVVLSQRPVVSGGVGGFFGKRMLEVVATDRMPTDDELVELEDGEFEGARDRAAGGERKPSAQGDTRSRLDVVDDWDPASDDELAAEYGTVLRHVAAATDSAGANAEAAASAASEPIAPTGRVRSGGEAGTYEPLELPRRRPTISAAGLAAAMGGTTTETAAVETGDVPVTISPEPADSPPVDVQTRTLTARAHRAIEEATQEIERQLAGERTARPSRSWPATTSTFRAEVVTGPVARHVDMAATSGAAVAHDLAVDLNLAPAEAPQPIDVAPAPTPVPEALRPVTERTLFEAAQALDGYLRATGTDADIAQAVVSKVVNHRRPFAGAASDLRALAREVVAELVRVETGWDPVGRAHRMAFVGPSGSGKSSVVAKLAESYSRSVGYRVGVISIMPNTVAVGQHGLRNDPLLQRDDLDVHFVATPEQMSVTIERMSDCDVVLIDTPSTAYLDPTVSALVRDCLAAARVDDVHAVVPLATSLREAESVVEHFRPMQLNRLVVSKIDESRFAGQLLNYGYRFGLPITYLSDGPQVPGDLRAASAQEIARLIVPHQH